MRPRILLFAFFGLCMLLGSNSAWAHDEVFPDIINLALGESYDIDHYDSDPFKGTLTLTVTNTGVDLWGDFHFQILDNQYNSVTFDDGASLISNGVSSYTVDTTNNDHDLNFYFYNDPIGQNESVTFQVYTNNTSGQLPLFGMTIAPSPVPLPGAVWFLASGLAGIFGISRKKKSS